MRLIDADALKTEFEDLAANQWNKETHTTCARVFQESAERVEDAKTIDAVEVVRCEDCKRWDDVPVDETQDHECHLFDGNEEGLRIATPSYWFCPKGERKSE